MKLPRRSIAMVGLLIAASVVFAPLLAALAGTGLSASAVAEALRGSARPLLGSAGTSAVAGVVSLALGVPFAMCVERSRTWVRRACWAVGLAVLMVPPYVVAEAWIVLLGPVGKLSRGAVELLGFGPAPGDPMAMARFSVPGYVYSWPAVGVVMGGCLFPIVALAVASAFRRTDQRMFESARLAQGQRGVLAVGARAMALPALGAGLLVFAATLTEFAVPQLLRVSTVGEAIYERIQEGELPVAAALSLPLMPLVLGAGGLGAWALARSRAASLAGMEGEVPKFTARSRGLRGDVVAGCATVIAATPALLLPALSLGWLASTWRLTEVSAEVSTDARYRVLRASGFGEAMSGAWELARSDAFRTAWLAALAATVSTFFAVMLARAASRAGWGWMLGVLGAGLAVPASIVGLGLIALWDRGWGEAVYQSWGIVLLAWLARFFPVGVFLSQGALSRVPRELESAAALAGRGAVGRLWAVVLPGAAPGIVAAWLAVYVLSATEFSATLLVSPPGGSLLAPSVLNLIRRGQDPEIAACQVLLLAVVAIPLLPLGAATAVMAFRFGRKGESQ
jgi:iron(III) transport system permease protein